jgi:hypothetical protein
MKLSKELQAKKASNKVLVRQLLKQRNTVLLEEIKASDFINRLLKNIFGKEVETIMEGSKKKCLELCIELINEQLAPLKDFEQTVGTGGSVLAQLEKYYGKFGADEWKKDYDLFVADSREIWEQEKNEILKELRITTLGESQDNEQGRLIKVQYGSGGLYFYVMATDNEIKSVTGLKNVEIHAEDGFNVIIKFRWECNNEDNVALAKTFLNKTKKVIKKS